MLAMDEIVFQFIGDHSVEKSINLLDKLVPQPSNQYSFENCWVVEVDDEVVAVANIYDGEELQKLIVPVAETIKLMFKKEFNPENETQAGEFYIDCIGVRPDWQRKGIGSYLLNFLINEYVKVKHETIGLLVEKDKPDAKRLYLSLGFKKVGEMMLVGKPMEHLQIK